jgi:hypothetical protein
MVEIFVAGQDLSLLGYPNTLGESLHFTERVRSVEAEKGKWITSRSDLLHMASDGFEFPCPRIA